MKKSTKTLSLLLGTMLALGGFAGCNFGGGGGGGGAANVDEKTIVIKCRRAGFGTDWLYELKGHFEKAYAAEGYKVHIMTPDNSIKDGTLIQELYYGYDKTGVDLYISSGATPDQVGALGDYGILVEEIDDLVYNKKAISYDGTEESKLISEKLSEEVLSYMTDSNGKVYAYNWAQTSGGLAVNTRKLAKYNLELPRTTNEMFDCFDTIYCGNGADIKNSVSTGTYPITYVSGTNGYGLVFLYAMLAQYDGEFLDKFWSFQAENESGQISNLSDAECQNLYKDPAVQEMLTVAFQAFDARIAAPGSLSNTVDQAQAKIMGDVDDAVFMFNGDWMLNEVKLNYKDDLHDIDFINFPVVSAVGVKVFGEGTAYGLDDEKCDELLSYIIGLVDQNKDIDEIVSAVKQDKNIVITEEDASEIARARGVTYSRGVEHVAYITKGSTKKEIVSLFLRMMSSDDFGETFNRVANGTSPYCAIENTTSEYAFVRNASKIPTNKYFSLVSLFTGARGYRKQLGVTGFFTTISHLPDHISSKSTATVYTEMGGKNGNSTDVYATAASNLVNEEVTNLVKNWEKYKQAAGIK